MTSKIASAIGFDLHARLAWNLAAFAMGAAVDGDAALKANSHAAERGARLPGDGPAEFGGACHGYGGGHHTACGYVEGEAVDAEAEGLGVRLHDLARAESGLKGGLRSKAHRNLLKICWVWRQADCQSAAGYQPAPQRIVAAQRSD
jgi:hypothetical protein